LVTVDEASKIVMIFSTKVLWNFRFEGKLLS
jgi:hypothetical protein